MRQRKNYFSFNDCVLLELDCYAKRDTSKDRAVLKEFVLKN
ncbi:hypothetical protein [Helicobacter pylori]|nr:hypothetical protein [Helicobacter pylori]